MDLEIKEVNQVERKALIGLYDDAGWTAYTKNPEELEKAIFNSQYVLIAKDNNKLVGLLRTVGDGTSIVYIQDILVHSDYKRNKIGTSLMQRTLEKFKHVRQLVLLTDDTAESRGFYESLGFESCDKGKLVSFVRMKE